MATAALRAKPETFFDRLRRSRNRALLLDYDGTLAPFTTERDHAIPYPRISELLDCIMSTCQTRVVLISGRPAREIPPLLGLDPHPEIWGTYGLERLYADGRYERKYLGEDSLHVLAEADAWLEEEGLGRIVERKPGSVAIHWRGLGLNEMEEVRISAYRVLSPIASESGLLLREFDGGLELQVPSGSKGDALRDLLSDCGPDITLAYLGDDVSDEEAFRALQGVGLTVLVRPTYRVTSAEMWLRPPADLVQFLADWIRACGGDM